MKREFPSALAPGAIPAPSDVAPVGDMIPPWDHHDFQDSDAKPRLLPTSSSRTVTVRSFVWSTGTDSSDPPISSNSSATTLTMFSAASSFSITTGISNGPAPS